MDIINNAIQEIQKIGIADLIKDQWISTIIILGMTIVLMLMIIIGFNKGIYDDE